MQVVVDLFKDHNDGIIPFSKIWVLLEDRTNGRVNPYKTSEMETESYGMIYKTTVSKMLRDRFGAKNPVTRDANIRCLVFDIEKTRKVLEDYMDKGKFKIKCKSDLSDSSDSSDSVRKDPFASFFNNISSVNTENGSNPIGNYSNEKEKREGYREDLDRARIDLSSNDLNNEKDKNRNL